MQQPPIIAQSRVPLSKCAFTAANSLIQKKRRTNYSSHTSVNTFVASSYRKLIFSFIHDSLKKGELDVDNNQVTIIEVGGGSGHLAYLILRQITNNQSTLPTTAMGNITINYILTDKSEKNCTFWEENGYFKFYIEKKIIDFALFDPTTDKDIKLRKSGKVIDKTTIKGPVIVICNELFSRLPNDSFIVQENTLSEQQISVLMEGEVDDPLLITRGVRQMKWSEKRVYPPLLYEDDEDGLYTAEDLRREQKRREIEEGEDASSRPLPKEFECIQYYREAEWNHNAHFFNEMLEFYRTKIEDDSGFLFPIGGLQFIDNILELTKYHVYLIAIDQGCVSLDDLDEVGPPRIHLSREGGWWFEVNFFAIKKFLEMKHAYEKISFSSHLSGEEVTLKVCSFASGYSDEDLPHTLSSQNDIHQFGPDNYNELFNAVNHAAKPSTIHSLLRLSADDPTLLYQYKQILIHSLPKSDWKNQIVQEMLRVWSNYYHLPFSEIDIPYTLGELFLTCERYEDAIRFFESSLQLNGDFVSTHFNIGICYEKMGAHSNALNAYLRCEGAKSDAGLEIDFRSRIETLHAFVENVRSNEEKQKLKKERKNEEKRGSENIVVIANSNADDDHHHSRYKSKKIDYNREENDNRNLNERMSNRFSRYSKYEEEDESDGDENESEEDEGEESEENSDDNSESDEDSSATEGESDTGGVGSSTGSI